MKDLILILKYQLQSKARVNKKKKNTEKNKIKGTSILGVLASYLIIPIIFAASLSPILYFSMKDLNLPFSALGINSTYTLVDLIFGMQFFMFGIMFFINFAPSMISNLFESEMTEYYLTMPVKRSTIFWATSVDSFLMASLPLGMIIPMAVIYSIIIKANVLFTVLSILAFIIALVGIGALGAVIMSRFISKTGAKRLFTLSYLLTIILVVVMQNMMNFDNAKNQMKLAETFKNALGYVLNPLWIHSWLIDGIKGDFLKVGLLFAAGIILIGAVYYIANTSEFIISGKKTKKSKNLKYSISSFPTVKKEFKLIFRDATNVFMLVYPIILSAIFLFTGSAAKGTSVMIPVVFSMVAAMYAAQMASMMLNEERKIWPVPKLYPLTPYQLINTKIYIPTIIFFIEYIILTLAQVFMFQADWFNFILILPMGLIMYYFSLFGSRIFIQNPARDPKQKNVLTGKEVLKIEGWAFLYSLGIFIPALLGDKIQALPPFWIFSTVPKDIWKVIMYCIAPGLPIFLSVLLVIFIVVEIKKINVFLGAWE